MSCRAGTRSCSRPTSWGRFCSPTCCSIECSHPVGSSRTSSRRSTNPLTGTMWRASRTTRPLALEIGSDAVVALARCSGTPNSCFGGTPLVAMTGLSAVFGGRDRRWCTGTPARAATSSSKVTHPERWACRVPTSNKAVERRIATASWEWTSALRSSFSDQTNTAAGSREKQGRQLGTPAIGGRIADEDHARPTSMRSPSREFGSSARATPGMNSRVQHRSRSTAVRGGDTGAPEPHLRGGPLGAGSQRSRYMMCTGTAPSTGCRNALGTVPTTANPSDSHSLMARALVDTTALNCMPL